eukprot:CAMPEP_0185832056 /NCGR_PEP_ID=MMETSP1353-20130828/1861_1 /TAXON_ID=1077150 /ORGANISM="Erythrolobus australicus, Strain CCMP3124" /LENGTH=309 /DNA_ID=CAMNT_0028530193 /DNA_START=6 /DNA_END=935 /DNA_ORIENTATION=-
MAGRQSAAVKRILLELKELRREESQQDLYRAAPLEDDLFEWHFTVRGPPDSPFEGGLYHGRILLPPEYPLKAPEIILLTPNGRFETGKRICLSFTSFHQETWQPCWGVRTMLTALLSFMPSKAEGIGALDYSDNERRVLASRSRDYVCPSCGVKLRDALPERADKEGSKQPSECVEEQLASTSAINEGMQFSDKAPPEQDRLCAAPLQHSAENDLKSSSPAKSSTAPHEASGVRDTRSATPAVLSTRQNRESEAAQRASTGEAQSFATTSAAVRSGESDAELKLVAYAIAALIIAIIARRFYKYCIGEL